MVHLSSTLVALAFICLASAAPLAAPFGVTWREISIAEDGSSITLAGPARSTCQGSKASGDKKAPPPGGKKGANSTVSSVGNAKALYFMTNAAANSVVALNVAADGTLSDGSMTATGGAGMTGVDSTGAPAVPDALFSQGAVKVSGNNVLAVNPGSNTVSMFSIDAADPTKLTMVGTPAHTLGEFPMSVAVSSALKMACVANGGAKAGVACFSMDATTGLKALDGRLRAFAINQTTPPKGPTNTVSQTFFNADSTALMTTVKGDPSVDNNNNNNNTGFLSVFPVDNGVVSTTDVRSSPAGTAVLFGTALIPGSNKLFVTDASFGSATLSLSSAHVASVSASTKIADQSATCWATISNVTNSAFVTDVAVNHLVEVDTATGQLIEETQLSNGNPGMIDLVAAGNFVYALSPGNASVAAAVTVFDVSGGKGTAKQIQNFKVSGVTASAQGMAFI